MHFHLLDEVLNVPLHGMPVLFDGVKRDLVLAAPRFETVRMFKFSSYGLGIILPERGQLVQVMPWVLARFSIDHSTEVGPYIQHHKRISLAVQAKRLCPMIAQSMCHSSRGATALLMMPAALRYVAL